MKIFNKFVYDKYPYDKTQVTMNGNLPRVVCSFQTPENYKN